MNDDQVLEQLSQTDIYAPGAPMPVSAWSRETALSEIDRRMGMDTRDTTNRKATPPSVTQQIEPSATPKAPERLTKETGKRRWSGPLVAAAAFAVVVVVVGAVMLLASLGSDELAPATLVTTQSPTTLTSAEALAVSGDFIERFNTGDAAGVLGLLTPDVTFAEKSSGGAFEAIDRVFFEMGLAWGAAQGTTLTSPECAVTDQGVGAVATVSCEFGIHEAPAQAVDAPPVPTVLTMVVTPGGIRQLAYAYGQPDFLLVGAPFDGWILGNHSDDAEVVGFGNWASVDEAEQGGILRAQYAEEWAAFLDENGCVYTDGC